MKPDLIVITGPKHSGKTTLVKKIVNILKNKKIKPYGFITEYFKKNKKSDYILKNIYTGEKFTLLTTDGKKNWEKTGKYYFIPESIKKLKSIFKENLNKKSIFILDELGPAEIKYKKGIWKEFLKLFKKQDISIIVIVRENLLNEFFKKALYFIFAGFILFFFYGCSDKKAIAKNENDALNSQGKIYFLVYHSFKGDNPENYFDIPKKEFEEHINYLKNNGFKFISFKDIEENKVTGDNNIMITIDDGKESVWNVYFEVLKPNNIKPVLGIYPAIIGKVKYALTWEQLKTLSEEGCEIASHGYYHLKLDEKTYNEHKNDFINEIYKSKKVLENKINKNIKIFIYPFGISSVQAKEKIKKAGYKYAFNIKGNYVNFPLEKNPDIYELSRYMITTNNYKGVFTEILRNNEKERSAKK